MIARQHISLLVVLMLALSACQFFQRQPELKSQKVIRDGRTMLYGKITPEQLYFDYPAWKTVERNYQPQKAFVEKLKTIKQKTTVKIFMATWCPDSKREVPHFFKIVKSAHLGPILKIEMWAVDRKKQSPDNLARKYGIKYVPTFIFERNGKEIGRIVESPRTEFLEEDMYRILSGKSL